MLSLKKECVNRRGLVSKAVKKMSQWDNTVQSMVNPVDTSYLIKGETYLVGKQEPIILSEIPLSIIHLPGWETPSRNAVS